MKPVNKKTAEGIIKRWNSEQRTISIEDVCESDDDICCVGHIDGLGSQSFVTTKDSMVKIAGKYFNDKDLCAKLGKIK